MGEAPPKRQPSGQVKRQTSFSCVCGNEVVALIHNVTSGKIQSCGCLNQGNRTKHGLAAHPLARIWYGMHDRCTHDKNYNGRGITVCSEWSGDNGLSEFITWATTVGYTPDLEIDREDNDGGYSPGNCRFVSATVNQRNKRNALKVAHPTTGAIISLITLWEGEGNDTLSWSTVRNRYLYLGWSVADAILKPRRGYS